MAGSDGPAGGSRPERPVPAASRTACRGDRVNLVGGRQLVGFGRGEPAHPAARARAFATVEGRQFLIYAYFSSATPFGHGVRDVSRPYQCEHWRCCSTLNSQELTFIHGALHPCGAAIWRRTTWCAAMAGSDPDGAGAAFVEAPDNRDFFYLVRRRVTPMFETDGASGTCPPCFAGRCHASGLDASRSATRRMFRQIKRGAACVRPSADQPHPPAFSKGSPNGLVWGAGGNLADRHQPPDDARRSRPPSVLGGSVAHGAGKATATANTSPDLRASPHGAALRSADAKGRGDATVCADMFEYPNIPLWPTRWFWAPRQRGRAALRRRGQGAWATRMEWEGAAAGGALAARLPTF